MAEIKVPELAESITEGTIAQWLKKPGDYVEKGEYIVELETDKVNVEVISEEAGTIQELKASEGDTVEVGQIIAVVGAGSAPSAPAAEAPPETQEESSQQPAAEEAEASSGQRPIASPAARKLAREKGIDLSKVQAVDPLGRVRVQDVEQHGTSSAPAAPIGPSGYGSGASGTAPAASSISAPATQTPAPQKQAAAAPQNSSKPVERERMSRRRQTIAKRLVEVQQTAAMLTTFNEVDMTNVMALRSRKKDKFYESHDVRLGFMSFFTKAVVAALKKYPYVNAEIDGNEVVLKKFYDIGVAVSTEDGLVVPVVRDCDRKNFAEIEGSIMDMALKARDNKLALSDLQGGTFTITNGGVFGSLLSTPILNGSQVGILGMHTIQKRPVAIGDAVEIRPMMYLALSYDHRIIDGKEAVGFLKMVKELIENPEDLLLEG